MEPSERLSENDLALVESARAIIKARGKKFWHVIGAALRTRSGQIFSAVHIEAGVGRVAVCAEAIAIGMAASAGDTEIESIVAVYADGTIASPCGMCRELISDYSATASVIVPGGQEGILVPIESLIPNKYKWTP
jgi:cytidine deaminase